MLQYQSGNLYAEQQMKNYIQSSLIPPYDDTGYNKEFRGVFQTS